MISGYCLWQKRDGFCVRAANVLMHSYADKSTYNTRQFLSKSSYDAHKCLQCLESCVCIRQ